MKRSKQDTAATRAAIVENASREFRKSGLQLSVADLMEASGLTHGGFYRHFESKEELIGEAARHALRAVIQNLIDVAVSESDKKVGLRRLIERYLSVEHREGIAEGCLVAALGAELTRTNDHIREIVVSESARLIEVISGLLEGADAEDPAATAQFLAAGMTGLLTMSRLMPKDQAEKFLANAREHLIRTYCR